MVAGLRFFQVFRQTPADLVEDQADQRLGPGNVRWRYDQVERSRTGALDEIADAPIALSRDPRNDRIAIETEERHRRRQDTGPLIVVLVEDFTRHAGDNRVHAPRTQMR